jgi:gliding motility-associated-like protein
MSAQQNLVPNGDFEYYTQCPEDYGQTERAYPWYQPNIGSSDYFNSCVLFPGSVLDVDVPSNTFGLQYAHSGEGYCGFGSIFTSDYYEYIATPLTNQLIAGENYCVSFWLSLSDTMCYAINSIGAYFSNDSIPTSVDYNINVSPQINSTQFISDKENWILIEGNFIADGSETFLAIGTFAPTNIDTLKLCDMPFDLNGVYYYIDDVRVQLCTDSPIPENPNSFDIPNVFSPNNDGLNDNWTVNSKEEIDVIILNRWGNIVFQSKTKNVSWNGEKAIDGVYYYIIKTENEQKTGFIQLIR